MAASEVVENISKSGTVVPVSERQARPLAKLPEENRPAFRIWRAFEAQVDPNPFGHTRTHQ